MEYTEFTKVCHISVNICGAYKFIVLLFQNIEKESFMLLLKQISAQ